MVTEVFIIYAPVSVQCSPMISVLSFGGLAMILWLHTKAKDLWDFSLLGRETCSLWNLRS